MIKNLLSVLPEKMPKVSICIPTYNNLEAFKRCFNSVLIQTYTDYEVVVTDDSSNEDIQNYLAGNSDLENVFYFKNQKALGSPENWNEAIRKSKGEYIKILHHDDWFTYKNSLEIFVRLLDESSDCNLAFLASKNYDVDKKTVINYNNPSLEQINKVRQSPVTLLNGNIIGAPSAVIFRKADSLLFDAKTIWFVDIDFYVQILNKNNNLKYDATDAISIGISTSQITKSVEKDKKINIFEHFYFLNKWNIQKIISSQFEHSTVQLLKKFNIYSIYQIRKLGYENPVPSDLNALLLRIFRERIKKTTSALIKSIVNKIKR
ncbi:glycosyltransferase [Chryseobacterium sp. LC2016-29]|uniref:glycosyltransferase family 2 protein n=1 Tax=Chryseobacterium sp. LC2016-29 TaxID=2897331 RepID=UPI001E598821|nr:glycosyltransferase family 2 protein [Chryseobacterium sp. LC2016-29]MCD0478495.1 glycosyltransferase [Chryseobacterium sp. LC2016-29]